MDQLTLPPDMDYSALPHGTLVQLRNGQIFTLGPHPTAPWVSPDHQGGMPIVLWKDPVAAGETLCWMPMASNGRFFNDTSRDSQWDIVGAYVDSNKGVINAAAEDPTAAYDRAMKALR